MQLKKVLPEFFKLCPDAKSCTQVAREEIMEAIRSLGLQSIRAANLQRLSEDYLGESWTYVTELHGVGKYVVLCALFLLIIWVVLFIFFIPFPLLLLILSK